MSFLMKLVLISHINLFSKNIIIISFIIYEKIKFIYIIFISNKFWNHWGLGIGDWGLGIGDWEIGRAHV